MLRTCLETVLATVGTLVATVLATVVFTLATVTLLNEGLVFKTLIKNARLLCNLQQLLGRCLQQLLQLLQWCLEARALYPCAMTAYPTPTGSCQAFSAAKAIVS